MTQLANLFRTRFRKIAESASIRKRFYGWKEAFLAFKVSAFQVKRFFSFKEIVSIELWKALSSSDTDSPFRQWGKRRLTRSGCYDWQESVGSFSLAFLLTEISNDPSKE